MSATDSNGPSLQIPVIDISREDAQTADLLVGAVAEYGFVFVRGQRLGFTPQILDGMFDLSQEFFTLPVSEKEKCAIQDNNIGWSSMHSETLDPKHQKRGDFKEAMNFGEFRNGKARQALPPALASREADLYHFGVLCHELCIKLLRLIALGIGVDLTEGGEDWFASRHDPSKGPSGSVLRLLHYPAVAKDADLDTAIDVRAGAHSDYGSLTLLYQRASQSGLEILTPSSGWSPVPVSPPGTQDDPFPPVLVNIGDLMHFWTNGLLKSTVHRVVFPEGESKDRYSIAYFCHPLDHIQIEPVPSHLVKESSKNDNEQSPPVHTAEGYLKQRLRETYNWGSEQD